MGSDSGSDSGGADKKADLTQQKKEDFSFWGSFTEDLGNVLSGNVSSPHSAHDVRGAKDMVSANGGDPDDEEQVKEYLRGGDYGPGSTGYDPQKFREARGAHNRMTEAGALDRNGYGHDNSATKQASSGLMSQNMSRAELSEPIEDVEADTWDDTWLGVDKPQQAPSKKPRKAVSHTPSHSVGGSPTMSSSRKSASSQEGLNLDLDSVDTSKPDDYYGAQAKNIAAMNAKKQADEQSKKAEQDRQRRAREKARSANPFGLGLSTPVSEKTKPQRPRAANQPAQAQTQAQAATTRAAIDAFREHQAAKLDAAGVSLAERQARSEQKARARDKVRQKGVTAMMDAQKRGQTLSSTDYYAGPGRNDYGALSTRATITRSLLGEDANRSDTPAALDAEDVAANQRTADALVKTGDFSGFVPAVHDALRMGGKKAQVEVADLVMRMDARNPKHAVKFLEAIVQGAAPQQKPSTLNKSDLATMDVSPHHQTPQTPGLLDLNELDIGPNPLQSKSMIGPGVDVAVAPLAAAPVAVVGLGVLGVLTIIGADKASKSLRDAIKDMDPFRNPTPPSELPEQPGVNVETFPPADPGLLSPTPPSVSDLPQYPGKFENIPGQIDVPDVVEAVELDEPKDHNIGEPLDEITENGLAGGRNQSDVEAVKGVISSSGISTHGDDIYTEQDVGGGFEARDRDFEELRDVLGVDDKGVTDKPAKSGGRYRGFFSKSGDVEVKSYDVSKSKGGPTIKVEVHRLNAKPYTIGRRY